MFLVICIGTAACAPRGATTDSDCATPLEAGTLRSEARALVFDPDPLSSSGDPLLAPTSQILDQYRVESLLARLTGQGILIGQNVDVRNGFCGGHFAFSSSGNFSYSHTQEEFSEVMAYFHADRFLAEAREIEPALGEAFQIWAHCMKDDNAYFIRGTTSTGQRVRLVCLGDSQATPGASMADDAHVIAHEVEHGVTTEMYSPVQDLNQLFSDEAGAINEGISDFLALVHYSDRVASGVDPLGFARWSLGEFEPNNDKSRGVNRCPKYDSDFPFCRNFSLGVEGFSADRNTVSYTYPDGLGWRFTRGLSSASGALRDIVQNFRGQDDIHVNGIILAGALWEGFERLRVIRGGDAKLAVRRAVMEALRHLPMPSATSISPVTMPVFARAVVRAADDLQWPQAEVNALKEGFRSRGLFEAPELPQNWASPLGMRIVDDFRLLRDWARNRGVDPARIPQSILTGLNGRPDPGEVVAIWFDFRNEAALSAGGLELEVTSSGAELDFIDWGFNPGFVSANRTQVRYVKVNGTGVVNALRSINPNLNVATSNTFFRTNPFFDQNGMTAVFGKINSNLHTGEWINLSVKVRPSNGPETTLIYQFQVGV